MGAEPRRPLFRVLWLALAAATTGLVLVLAACFVTREAPPPPPETSRLSSPDTLAPLFAAFAGLDRHQADGPVRLIQIGDSHTANDSFSGRMRERLQERFGAAGRGWLPAGVPYKYYRPHLVHVSETGWRHFKPNDHAGVALGLDASVAESQPRDSVMTIETETSDAQGFDRFAVEFLARPNGSPFTVQVDGAAPIRVPTAAAETAIKRFDLPLDRPAHRIELRAEGRPPVDLLGWTVERRSAGVIYENHGTIGATVDLLGQITSAAVAFELNERRPALIVIAFGTNEGFADTLDLDRYAGRFRSDVAALRRAAPGVPILILGTPDAARVGQGCTAAPCRADAEGDDCTWREPAKLAGVRELQRHIAAQQGWAYWDWFAAMGGACSIDRMAGTEPPLAMPDHVHLSKAGYQAIADLLLADLMREYDRWQAQPRGS